MEAQHTGCVFVNYFADVYRKVVTEHPSGDSFVKYGKCG
jgi:hypothetical protein